MVANVIGMPMVGVPPLYIIGTSYSNGYSNEYIIQMLYGGKIVQPVPLWYSAYDG